MLPPEGESSPCFVPYSISVPAAKRLLLAAGEDTGTLERYGVSAYLVLQYYSTWKGEGINTAPPPPRPQILPSSSAAPA